MLGCFLFISPVYAATLAVVYPDVPPPYKQFFEQLIDGIDTQHEGALVKYPLQETVTPAELLRQMRADRVDMVVTLGRKGFSYNAILQEHYPLVTGALPLSPNGIAGVSLISDPASLFLQLQNLAPAIGRVYVVYSDKSQWLIERAKRAAAAKKLDLAAFQVSNLAEAVDRYQRILLQADSEKDAIWLPLDTISANDKVVLPLLLRESWDRNLVVFSSKPGHVSRGFLFTLFPDNQNDGRRLAEMLNRMLHHGESPELELSRSINVGVNLRTASHLGLEYSPQMKKSFYQTFPKSGF